jgi:uncharacterized membrane protein HdeD (DUF308 family)
LVLIFLGVLAILGGLFYSNNLFGNSNNNKWRIFSWICSKL